MANRCFHTGVRDESHDDELFNTVFLELQIQIRVGKAARTPMLRGDNIARLWRKFAADLAAPGSVYLDRTPAQGAGSEHSIG